MIEKQMILNFYLIFSLLKKISAGNFMSSSSGNAGSNSYSSFGNQYKDFEGYTPNASDYEHGAHASGLGTHRGDAGANNILVARDVVHHGDGSIYVQKGDQDMQGTGVTPGNAMNVDDIHNAINKAIMDSHAAELAKKNMELKENQLKKDIENEKLKARNDQINMLKELDKQAAILEQQKPEVLGKKAIPVVNFTEDSYPLRHHIKLINSKINAIKEAERKRIQAQMDLTRLDDITDKFKFDTARIASPKLYNKFMQVGGVKNLELDIPVLGNKGNFYIKGNSGHGSHVEGNHVGSNFNNQADHMHYNNHGYHMPGSGLSGYYGHKEGDDISYGNYYKDALPYYN